MKVLFLIDNGKIIGGGDYAQFKFAEYLGKRGHSVKIFAANRNSFFDSLDKGLDVSIRHEFPRLFRGIGKINLLWDMVYSRLVISPFIKRNVGTLDYIIGYLRGSAIKAVKLGEKFRVKTANFIFENPDWMFEDLGERFLKEYKGSFKKSWEKVKVAYLNSTILIPISKLTRKKCIKWLRRDISEPVYPGVEDPSFKGALKEYQIIYVGRLNEYKNVNEIISAISKISNAPKLVIVGTGEEESKLKKLAETFNVNCEFKGDLSDADKWKELQKSLFMVFPSSFEGFGMPPAEALVSGIPCVCSDIPIFKEIYKDYVEYFKEHDVKKLQKKMGYLLKNPQYCKNRGKRGRKYILSTYTWERAAETMEKILEKK